MRSMGNATMKPTIISRLRSSAPPGASTPARNTIAPAMNMAIATGRIRIVSARKTSR
ncbi:Uncharacterised protein [Mycobacteroides abscessus subsp. abscessus]|nr:Uncharacterised protein [Mycobacteroides abscessus subsp. abscessus]SKV04986.1 Uncharacterised protein [Mycobacteroides abscessus subsp. abscessus]